MEMKIAVSIILNNKTVCVSFIHMYFACNCKSNWWQSPLFSNDMLKAGFWPHFKNSFSYSN